MIRFSSVNRVSSDNHNPDYQRHHIIPKQAGASSELRTTFEILTDNGFIFDDFQTNGILLPCNEKEAAKTGRPLHRGPHPRYNEIVIDRLIKITKLSDRCESEAHRIDLLSYRTVLLQKSLRRGLDRGSFVKLRLNSRDPMRSAVDFSNLDARIDELYHCSQPVISSCTQFSLQWGEAEMYLAEL